MPCNRSSAFQSTASGLTVLGCGAEVSLKNDFSSDWHVPTKGESNSTPKLPFSLCLRFFLPPVSPMDECETDKSFFPFPLEMAFPTGAAPIACPSPNRPILFHRLACSSASPGLSIVLDRPVCICPSFLVEPVVSWQNGGVAGGPGGGGGM